MMRNLIKIVSLAAVVCLLCGILVSAFAASDGSVGPGGSYIVGDVDGDGTVTVVDATTIQRVLALMITDPDGSYALRGDVDLDGSLTSLDATLMLRYLALMKVNYPIGEVRELPTEPPTETVKPTVKPDPYELPLVG